MNTMIPEMIIMTTNNYHDKIQFLSRYFGLRIKECILNTYTEILMAKNKYLTENIQIHTG